MAEVTTKPKSTPRHATPPLHSAPPEVAGNHQQAHIDAELDKLAHVLQRRNKACPTCQEPPCPIHHTRAREAVGHDYSERVAVLESDGGLSRKVAEVRGVVVMLDMYGVPHY